MILKHAERVTDSHEPGPTPARVAGTDRHSIRFRDHWVRHTPSCTRGGPSRDDFAETTVCFDLQATATGTRVLVTHTGLGDRAMAAEGTGEGWRRVLEWLGEHLTLTADA